MLRIQHSTDYLKKEVVDLEVAEPIQEKYHIGQIKRSSQHNKEQDLQQQLDNGPSLKRYRRFDSDDEREKKAELFSAIRKGNLQKVVQLLNSGVQVNIIDRNNKDNTPLHYAIEKGNKEIVEELLLQKWKTDINAKNNKGDTPLHIAASKGNKELVQLLLSKHAKIDTKNNIGDTPLDIAKRLEPERKGIFQILETSLDLKPQQLEYKAGQQPSGHPVSIATGQQVQSQHRNKNTNVDSQNTRRKQGDPVHGNIYQLKLLMLFLYRGVSHEYSFRLGTEIEEAKKFDDLVFEYTKGGRKEYRLLQAKHRLDESKKITSDNLLTESDGDYSLTKYFFSYQDSKKEKLFKGGSIKDVTICTNIDLDFEHLESAQIRVEKIEDKDDILDVKSNKKQPTRYRFNEDVTSLLKPKLQDYNLTRLARRLTECILKSSSIKHHESNDVFKSYHLALAEEVIDIKNRKFHDKFIKNEDISEDAKKFRKTFIEEIKGKSEGKLTLENINEAIVSKRKVIDNKPVGLNLSKNFGKGEDKNWPNNAVSDDEIKGFLNQFVFAVNQPNEEELGKIIKDEIGEEFDLDMTENIYNKFFMTMLNWLQGKERGRFLSYEEAKEFFEEARRGIPIWFDVKNPVILFTGRKQELSDLHSTIQRGSEGVTVISQMTSISGLGGIGKTELARKYAYDHGNDYDGNVIWINAASEATLIESFRRLAQDKLRISTKNADGNEKDIKSIVEEVYRFFTKRRSLFIFDNADKSDDLKKFLPLSTLSSDDNVPYILVTSRNQVWKEGIEVLNLNELNLEDAIEFVKKGLSIPKEDVSQDRKIEKLVKKLQYFPLALQQAIAHMREEKKKLKRRGNGEYTIGSYLEEYKEKKKELLNSKAFQSLDNDYAKTTFTTWKVTIDKIKDDKEYGQLALEILDVIAYFAPNNIPVENFFSKLEKDNEKLWKAVELSNQYSMIKLEQGELDIHRLVQEVTRLNLGDREKEVLEEALKLFQDGSSQIDLFFDDLRLSNVDHAISVWSYANKHEELVREFSSLPVLIVSELQATLRYQEAYLFGSNALKLLERILGDNHLSVLSMMKNIASVLYIQGKDNDSLEIYRKLKEKSYIINELVMPKRAFLFDNNIGLILNRQGKYDEALEIFSYLYSLVKEGKVYSDGSIEHNLAVTLFSKNKFDDAIKMYKNALKRKKEVLGSDHESTLNTENSIAIVLEMQGKYDEALEKCKEVYEKRKRILGLSHPDTLTTYGNIALLLSKQMQYDEALRIANEVEKEREKLFPNHPRALKGKLLIVGILDAQGKYDKALEKCKEVYEKRKKVLGPNHPDILTTLDAWYGLALKFAKQRKYDKALKELNEVLEERKRILKPNHPDILQTEDAISKVHRARDNGADINFKIVDPELFSAAQKGQLEVVNELLSKGVEVNVQTADEGYTPLHFAAHRNYLDVVNALLKGGADVNCYDNALFRPLHFAAQEGHTKIVELLLKNGADIEATNVDGLTPLHIAAYYKHLDVVKVLLEGGANIDAVNEHNMMPSDITNDESIKKVLLSTKQLPNAIKRKHNQSNIQRLLEDGAVINYFSGTSRLTSLHYAVFEGNLDIVRLLLRRKSNVNVADEDGWTPLHYAAQDGNLDIVQLLLDKQADTNVRNSNEKTPLDLAQEKLVQDPQIYQKIIDILRFKSTDQQQKIGPIHQGSEVSAEECLPSTSGYSGRKRREVSGKKCLFAWEDVDEFNKEKDEIRDLDKIKIDSEKFVDYIKDLSEEKRSQLIGLADEVKVTGNSQGLIHKLTNNRRVMSHLARVGKISGMTMHGMMAKNVLADFLNGNYQGVAINVGFIAGGQGFAKVAEAASIKGLKLASEGKLLLGRSLKAASPFLARGTSAFVVYDLVNQVKALKNGTEEALVGVIGDSIYLGVDAAEIGIEIAEAFEVLEGVSSVTGPIGATIGAVVFVGTDIYMAVKRVDKIDQIIHLKGNERFIEGLRAFIGMQPEQYIEELMEEKQLYNQLVKQGFEYLQQHSDIQRYVFPTGKSVVGSCNKILQSKRICVSGGFNGCVRSRTVTSYTEKCTTKFEEDLDNTVVLDEKRADIKWSRAKPDNPRGSQLFCLPQGNYRFAPSYGSYLCKSAIGITDLSANKTGSYTLINLGEGEDYAKGFIDSPNIFVVNNGSKKYFGGNKDDIFIVQGTPLKGYFYGEGGVNTLDLTSFAPEEGSIDVKLHIGQVEDYFRDNYFGMSRINKFLGRKTKADQVFIACDGANDVKFVDGQGGSDEFIDHINIYDKDCAYEMQIVVRPNTVIYNRALEGNFHYTVPYGLGSTKVDFLYSKEELNLNNTFTFEYEPVEIKSIDARNVNTFNETLHTIHFNFSPMSDKEFNITISGASNPSYRLGNNTEIKVGNKGNLYMLENTNKSVDEIINNYLVVANRLNKMSFFIQSLLSNETVVIGSGNYEIIHNNPLHKSHLVGNGGENVYVIDSEYKALEVNKLPLPEVTIYNFDAESSVDTIDLRNLVQQARSKFSNSFELQILKSANDLLLKATVTEVKPTEDLSVSKMRKHEYFTVRLKDGVNWYNKTHVIVDSAPMKINLDNNEWSLKPQPLIFEKDKEVIVVTSQDVEENTELITPKRAGNYTFVRDHGVDLIITNAFDADITKEDLCTITLSKFYKEPKMETLSIKFTDKEIILKDHQEQISIAREMNVVEKEHKDQVYNDVFNHTKSSPEVTSSNQPMTHKHRHKQQTRHRRSENITSSAARPSSWINSCIAWMKDSIGGFFTSNSYTNGKNRVNKIGYSTNYEKQQTFNHKPQMTVLEVGDKYLAQADVNGTVLLADVLLAKRGKRQIYTSSMDQGLSQSQTLSSTLNIGRVFEEVVKKAALKSDISERRLNIDFVEIEKMEKEINNEIVRGRFDEISKILKLYAEKACPRTEKGSAGMLSPKKFDKFMAILNNELDVALNQSMLQKENSISLEDSQRKSFNLEEKKPRSYLDSMSAQGYLTQVRDVM